MNRVLAVLAALTILVVGVGMFWWLRGPVGSGKGGRPYTHMHCPECNLEMPYNKGTLDRPCPHCGPSGPHLIATVGPRGTSGAEEASPSAVGGALAAATLALVVLQGGFYGWILYARWRRMAEEAVRNQALVCRCPFCKPQDRLFTPQNRQRDRVCALQDGLHSPCGGQR